MSNSFLGFIHFASLSSRKKMEFCAGAPSKICLGGKDLFPHLFHIAIMVLEASCQVCEI